MAEFLQGKGDIPTLFHLFEQYCHQNIDTHENGPSLPSSLNTIHASLFPKEYDTFAAFLRALSIQIGTLIKEDQMAQSLGISRRKVKKYLHILQEHHIITKITPFYTDKKRELFRHEKYYFTHLNWYQYALGDMYGIGSMRMGMIENFTFIELTKKLHNTHTIHFWKKKSGTDIPFILRTRDTNRLTPISITLRDTSVIPQPIKRFYESYAQDIDSGMLLNHFTAQVLPYKHTSFVILPYPLI